MKKGMIAILAAGALAASCSIYHPQAVDIPLIGEQGEWRVDASAGLSTVTVLPDAAHLGATASCGITPWLSGQVHANYGGTDNFYLQAAPGLYRRIGGKAVAELYAGVGYGGAGSESDGSGESRLTYRGTYAVPFVQANFGWRDLGAFELGFGLKAGRLMPWFKSFHYDSEGVEDVSRRGAYTTRNTLLEPQLQVGVGSEKVKFVLRVGAAWLDDMTSDSSQGFSYDWLTLGAGLSFRF